MIVAVTGHIDHGKTSLVRVLTGVDTDRLPEEKARGISINLGFAYLQCTDGTAVGFIDVPGHERFIRNMLAGVCAIDFALLVVAADDGVMAQTIEHLQILDLLHVWRGVAVITKVDRVETDRISQVEDCVRGLLAGTGLANCPVLSVSTVTGAGVVQLLELLKRESRASTRRAAVGQYFRMTIDRAFTIVGSGTVVTGTVFDGEVHAGDRLLVSPSGRKVRVRSVQKHGAPTDSAEPGDRCALNLLGCGPGDIARGDWILAAPLHRPTRSIDALVSVLPSLTQPIKHWMPVHLHIATSDVTARVAIRRGMALTAGVKNLVRLVLDQPVGAFRGDRFILRDQSTRSTLGGGFIVDPLPPSDRRRSVTRVVELAAFQEPEPVAALARLLGEPAYHLDVEKFEMLYNLRPARAREIYDGAGVVVIGKEHPIGITREREEAVQLAVLSKVTDFHCAQPQAKGADIQALRGAIAPQLSTEAFLAVLRELFNSRKLEPIGSQVRLPGHLATANATDEMLWKQVLPILEAAGFAATPVTELAAQLGVSETVLRDFLHRKSQSGDVHKVGTRRFYARSTLAELASLAQATAAKQSGGLFTTAQYRDAIGVGRSLAVDILEHLDSLGITQRTGDARKIRGDHISLLEPVSSTSVLRARTSRGQRHVAMPPRSCTHPNQQ